MSNINKLANKIKNPPKAQLQWTLGKVQEISPLKIALYSGEVIVSVDDILKLTDKLVGYDFWGNETILCLVSKTKVIAVDMVV